MRSSGCSSGCEYSCTDTASGPLLQLSAHLFLDGIHPGLHRFTRASESPDGLQLITSANNWSILKHNFEQLALQQKNRIPFEEKPEFVVWCPKRQGAFGANILTSSAAPRRRVAPRAASASAHYLHCLLMIALAPASKYSPSTDWGTSAFGHKPSFGAVHIGCVVY